MTAHQLLKKVQEAGGSLWLKEDGHTVHLELPRGHEELSAELNKHKEQLRSLLRKRANTMRSLKAPVQGPPPPQLVYIPVACRCRKYPHPHVHNPPEWKPEDVIRVSGETAWKILKKQLRLAQEESKYPDFDAYAFELTQAMPPIVLHGPSASGAQPLESISVGELIQIIVDHEAPPAKKVEHSAWGMPKIKGYAKYCWDERSEPAVCDISDSWFLPIGVHVTAIEGGQVAGWIEWRTRAIDYEYVCGRRIEFQERSDKEELQWRPT
jgi:hypothetical protein